MSFCDGLCLPPFLLHALGTLMGRLWHCGAVVRQCLHVPVCLQDTMYSVETGQVSPAWLTHGKNSTLDAETSYQGSKAWFGPGNYWWWGNRSTGSVGFGKSPKELAREEVVALGGRYVQQRQRLRGRRSAFPRLEWPMRWRSFSRWGAEAEGDGCNLVHVQSLVVENYPKLSLQCKSKRRNPERLLLQYTLTLVSTAVTAREAEGNSLNCASLYCPQMLSYSAGVGSAEQHVLLCREMTKQPRLSGRVSCGNAVLQEVKHSHILFLRCSGAVSYSPVFKNHGVSTNTVKGF